MAESQFQRGAIYLLRGYTFPHEKSPDGAAKSRPVLILQGNYSAHVIFL